MGGARAGLARQPFHIPAVLACCLFAGCGLDRPMPLPPELTDAGVRSRLLISEPQPAHIEPIMPVRAETEADPDRSVFSLGDAVAYAQRHNPRLRSAKATLGGAKGQEEVAFAAFLPEVGIYGQSGTPHGTWGPAPPV